MSYQDYLDNYEGSHDVRRGAMPCKECKRSTPFACGYCDDHCKVKTREVSNRDHLNHGTR